jgi:hypothetical protein
MANPFPVIAICAAAIATSFGAAFFASASPNETRACDASELVAERFFAIETWAAEDGRRAVYYLQLTNPQSRPQVFNLAFDLADAQQRQTGRRAVSLPGQQSMPMLLGSQVLDAGAKPMTPEAIAQAARLNCRSW